MFMGPWNWCQGMNSARLCSLAGRYENPIPPRCLAPIDFLKIPALNILLSNRKIMFNRFFKKKNKRSRIVYLLLFFCIWYTTARDNISQIHEKRARLNSQGIILFITWTKKFRSCSKTKRILRWTLSLFKFVSKNTLKQSRNWLSTIFGQTASWHLYIFYSNSR
jgi:hypothetical protein